MKAFSIILLLGLLVSTAFNHWQVQQLRAEVAELKVQMANQQAGSLTNELVAKATAAILQARHAIGSAKVENAKAALNTAREYLAEAGKTAGAQAGPRLKWLQDQAQGIGRQIQDKAGR